MLIADPFSSARRPVLTGNRGAVSAAHPLAVSAGTGMLAAGGSAVDATIAAQAVLCVLSPDNCGLGGDQLCLVRAADGSVTAVNGTGAAPLAMEQADLDGGNSVTVPGIVDAWVTMHERWGRLPLARLMEPAMRLAADGFMIGDSLAEAFRDHSERLVRGGAQDWAMRTAPAGAWHAQPELAALLAAIGREGRDAFYSGGMADAIAAAIQSTGGRLDRQDLAGPSLRRRRSAHHLLARAHAPCPAAGLAGRAALDGAGGGRTAGRARFPAARSCRHRIDGEQLRLSRPGRRRSRLAG